MIITGHQIVREVHAGRILIAPFNPSQIEPNSYGFRIASHLLTHENEELNVTDPGPVRRIEIVPEGFILEPGRLYLGSTLETLGSPYYAATLYARRSTSTIGIWIQISAPLGHTGAVIPWTLEITVAHRVRIYPQMLVGKIAFWRLQGEPIVYSGKYMGAREAVPSRLAEEWKTRA